MERESKQTLRSWAVLCVVLTTNILTIGFVFGTFGVFVQYSNEQFSLDNSVSAWIGSVASGFMLGFAPISVIIVKWFGSKNTIIMSTLAAIFGMALTGYATAAWHIIITYSVITSASLCNLHIAGMEVLPQYFDKHLHVAYTIQGLGNAIGTLIFPFVMQQMLLNLEYKDVTLIIAAILSPTILGALVFKEPVSETKSHEQTAEESINHVLTTPPDAEGLALQDATVITHEKNAKTPDDLPKSAVTTKQDPPVSKDTVNSSAIKTSEQTDKTLSLSQAFRLHICRSPLIIYIIHRIFWNGGYVTLRVFIYNYIITQYNSPLWAGWALTLFAAGQLVMSIAMSLINVRFRTNKYMVQLVALALMVISACTMGIINNLVAIISLTLAYGGLFGVLFTNIRNIEKHLNAEQSHNLLYALGQMCGGIGALTTPPWVAAVGQADGIPIYSLFYLSAGMTCISFLLMFVLLLCKRELFIPFSETDDALKDTNQKQSGSFVEIQTQSET